ncbi:MAG: PAS domain S-box protein [Candidatus Methanofastidiosa archaeon]|nr:PAS domain S-box protein [Candidatus Methanofastidiosa archaeon]
MSRPYRVLHVEDDADYADLFELQMQRIARKHDAPGFSITVCSTAEQAITAFEREAYDIVVCDYQLKGSATGLDVLSSFRDCHRHLPFVFLTGQGDESVARSAFLYHATDYLTKDMGIVGYERIYHALVHHIEHHRTAVKRRALEKRVLFETRRVRELLDLIPMVVVSLDAQARVTKLNTYGCGLLGYRPKDVEGLSWVDTFIPAREREDVHAVFQECVHGDRRLFEQHENTILGASGDEHLISWHNSAIQDERGHILGTLSFGDDVTERRAAERQTAVNEAHYRTVVETASEGIWEIDSSGRTVYVNPSLCTMLGYTPEEMRGTHVSGYVPPARYRELETHIALRRKGASERYELPILTKDGNPVWCMVSASPLFDETGAYRGSLSLLTDITESRAAHLELAMHRERLEERVAERTRELVAANTELTLEIKRRKSIEIALKEREAQYASMVNTVQEGILILDEHHVVLFTNRKMAQFYDASEGPLEGRDFLDCISTEHAAQVLAFLSGVASGTPGTIEALISRDGRRLEVLISGAPVPGGKGDGPTILLTITDLTGVKLAQHRMEEVTAFYLSILDSIVTGVWVSNTHGRILYANKAMSRISGLKNEELVGVSLSEFPASVTAEFMPYYQKAESTLQATPYERIKVSFPSGGHSYQGGWLVPLVRDGHYDGMVCTVEDLTERTSIIRQLEAAEKRYLSLVKLSIGFLVLSDEGAVLEANEPFCASLGTAYPTIKGQPLLSLLDEQGMALVSEGLSHARTTGISLNVEMPFCRTDGGEGCLLASVLYDAGEKHYYVVSRDISVRKRAERELMLQREELSDYAHTVAHEIKNYLASQQAYAELLLSGGSVEELVPRLRASSERMLSFVAQQLQLADAGKAVGAYASVDVCDLVRDIHLPKGLEVCCQAPVSVKGDKERLSIVLSNLLRNAWTHGAATRVTIRTEMTSKEYVIIVEDNGSGIPASLCRSVFDMGVSTGGTGFGLPIVKRIVEAHNGTITVSSPEGKGATFTISLPFESGA